MINFESDEKIVCEVRKHWFVLLSESIFLFLLLFVPVIVFYVLDVFEYNFLKDYGALFVFLAAGWFLLTWISFLVVWTKYYLNVWIITSVRIIAVEQYGLFSRDISECRLDRVQDVTIEIKGLIPTLLKFGNIHLQTAGEDMDFAISRIPNPYQIKDVIMEAHDSAVEKLRDFHLGH
jgi:uncharacterized membrane protein YdbT with pleckstrin-like domain